jgi:hypothetical protein
MLVSGSRLSILLQVKERRVACSCSQPVPNLKPTERRREGQAARSITLHEEGGDVTLAKAGCASPINVSDWPRLESCSWTGAEVA